MTVKPETNLRATDVLGDVLLRRIGNNGTEYLFETLQKLESALGSSLEIYPEDPVSTTLLYTGGVYQMPDGRRMAAIKGNTIPALSSGSIDFSAGTISSGTNLSFLLPTMTAGYYVKALIQYSVLKNAIRVEFGLEGATLGAATIPVPLMDYDPLAVVELQDDGTGGQGNFLSINPQNIIRIIDSLDFDPEPQIEVQTVTGSPQSIFTLSSVKIPSQRKRMFVFIGGSFQAYGTHYAVNSDTEVEFSEAIPVNAEVIFVVI